ncbi:MAG: hypothetical protein LBL86_07850 [Coriobacteriales bacterium]|nr:hypothetical protein [Coriobacteriales bacterium]
MTISSVKHMGAIIRGFSTIALVLVMSIGLVGCGGGTQESGGGSDLAGTIGGEEELKYVHHIYFGVAELRDSDKGKSGFDLALARAVEKAVKAEGENVDYMEHRVDLNSGCQSAPYIAMVNTYTKNGNDALTDVVVRICKTSGVANMSSQGVDFTKYDPVDLNQGAGGRFLYLLEGHNITDWAKPLKGVAVHTSNHSRSSLKDQPWFTPDTTWYWVTESAGTGAHEYVDLNNGAGGDYIYMEKHW